MDAGSLLAIGGSLDAADARALAADVTIGADSPAPESAGEAQAVAARRIATTVANRPA